MIYYTLGNTGLKVSRLALGTMTFGTEWGWGADEAGAEEMYSISREAGINLFDTADFYTGGTSEEWLGRFVRNASDRDNVVLATKYSLNSKGDPNTGGNARKHMISSVEESLSRMGTDYIDLYYLHVWDRLTPAEEVMRTFDDLVSSGKVRYVALSDVPAWYAARAQTIAEFRGYEKLAAIQLQYSLVERSIEHEYTDLCAEMGIGLVPWGPMGGGLLSGKYKPSEGRQPDDAGRLAMVQDDQGPAYQKFSERNWTIISALEEVANQIGQSMATTALNWVVNRPGVGSVLLGASKPEQLRDNVKALEFDIPTTLKQKLNEASAIDIPFPHSFFGEEVQGIITGGHKIGNKHPNYEKPFQVFEPPKDSMV